MTIATANTESLDTEAMQQSLLPKSIYSNYC